MYSNSPLSFIHGFEVKIPIFFLISILPFGHPTMMIFWHYFTFLICSSRLSFHFLFPVYCPLIRKHPKILFVCLIEFFHIFQNSYSSFNSFNFPVHMCRIFLLYALFLFVPFISMTSMLIFLSSLSVIFQRCMAYVT